MNTAVLAAIATELATLTRIVAPSTEPLLYGLDLSCVTDIEPTLAEVDPASPRAIIQAVIRRFTTPRGALLDDPDYGLDIRAVLSRGATQRDVRAISGSLQGEAQKDDRVARCEVKLVASLLTRRVDVSVSITPEDPALKDFDFTFAVTDASVLMVTIHG